VVVAALLILIGLMFVWFQASRPSVYALLILGPIAFMYGFHAWYIWWNNLYLVTNQRVMIITHKAVWSRRVEDYGLDKIQSLASETQGMASAMLNFGTILMAVIGVKEPVALYYIEDAYSVQERIQTAINDMNGRGAVNRYDDRGPKRRLRID
jgi:hypothetical protein